MGDAFEPWADVYFSDESGRLDKMIMKEEALNDYVKGTNQKNLTTQRFTKSLHAWCYYHNYVLNPKELQNRGGRVIKMTEVPDGNGGTRYMAKEMVYIKTKEISATEAVLERYNKKVAKQQAAKADETDPFAPVKIEINNPKDESPI